MDKAIAQGKEQKKQWEVLKRTKISNTPGNFRLRGVSLPECQYSADKLIVTETPKYFRKQTHST